MRPEDWDAVRAIYLEGIATGNSTFEQSAPDWQAWDQRHLPFCRLVARVGNQVLGWTALSAVSHRPVYAGAAEFSIYVAERARRRGIGTALLHALIVASEQQGIWTLQSGIFPENTASLEL
jgi:L-amino acid N-acyltransferase YncA